MKTSILGMSSCVLASAVLAVPMEPKRPNLVIVFPDQMRGSAMGFLGEEPVKTPRLDRFAAEAAVLTQAVSCYPVCSPFRASLMTGQYCFSNGVWGNCNSKTAPGQCELPATAVCWSDVLKGEGYSLGYIGKWHLDGAAKPGWAPKRQFGFEDNAYMFNRGHWKQLEDTPAGPRVKARNAKGVETYEVSGADEKSFTTDFLAAKTVDFIQANKDRPFCFMVSLPDPHGPNTVRPPYDTMYAKMAFKLPASAEGQGRMENMARYFGMVKCIDDNVGKILEGLDKAGVLDKTMVVFTADHGDMCGEHALVNKGVPFDASARVPFIIAYPAKIRPGTVIREALSTVDFKPTVLGLLGLPAEGSDEGRDASELLLTGKPPAGWKDAVFSRNAAGIWLMAVSARYKFIVFPNDDPCLYDLDADPFETRNLCREPAMRETVRGLARSLSDYAVRCKEPFAETPAIRADLDWAAGAGAGYQAPARPVPAAKAKKNGKRREAGEDE